MGRRDVPAGREVAARRSDDDVHGDGLKRALVLLACCGKPASEPPPAPPPPPITADAARTWPVAPAPTVPIDLPWPPALDDAQRLEDGVRLDDAMVYGVTIPSSYPRLFLTGYDLATLEAAWGRLARTDEGYAVWWNPAAKIRARFDVPHPTPSKGRGLEIAPYVSTLDRVANLDELVIANQKTAPPGEWDPGPVAIWLGSKSMRFVTRVDGPPVDAAAVMSKLREVWGEPTVAGDDWTFAKGRVLVRRQPPSIDITYQWP